MAEIRVKRTGDDAFRVEVVEGKERTRHEVRAKVEYTVAHEISVGDALLDTISDRSCDLLVMGGYGHSRMRELTLGGVTRDILQHMTVPVLMSH